ncbi:hypothetical protein SLA2020_275370 [Shorea laevis]
MGNCFGTQVNHHHSPSTTKTTSTPETSRNNSKQTEGTARSYSNAAQNGNVIVSGRKSNVNVEERPQAAGKIHCSAREGLEGFQGLGDETTYAPTKVGTGIAVAVKKSNPDSPQGMEEWLAEVKFLGKFSHPNLVKLLGYCWEDKEYLLVYEYMQKGSLENHLFRKGSPEPLPWDTRLKIAIGAAQGLSFLHTSEKSDYNVKLSDFGLAKLGPINGNSHVTTRVMGTYGYAAPEYVETGHLYVKSDVYGFGVVLLEILTGLRAHDLNRTSHSQKPGPIRQAISVSQKETQENNGPKTGELYPLEGACQAAQLILRCLESDPKNRPSMEQVLDELENINTIKMTTKETKSSAKQGTNKHQEEHTKHQHQHRYNHHRSPNHQKKGFTGAGARAYHH